MATHNLTYKFGNNFENESSSAAVSIPAQIQGEGARGVVSPIMIQAGDVVTAFAIPANCIIQSFYLVTEEAMAGTVTVALSGGTEIFPALTDVTTVGLEKATVSDVYVDAPYDIEVTFSDTQVGGSIKVAFDFIQLDTNTAKYLN